MFQLLSSERELQPITWLETPCLLVGGPYWVCCHCLCHLLPRSLCINFCWLLAVIFIHGAWVSTVERAPASWSSWRRRCVCRLRAPTMPATFHRARAATLAAAETGTHEHANDVQAAIVGLLPWRAGEMPPGGQGAEARR